MKPIIVVIDGLGGGVGAQLTSRLRDQLGHRVEIIALGTNASATERMLRAGADRGASGENAIRCTAPLGDLIVGPIGIVIPNSMMGEVTLPMVEAIYQARGERILLPLAQSHCTLVGLGSVALGDLVVEAVEIVKGRLQGDDRFDLHETPLGQGRHGDGGTGGLIS